MDDQKQILNKEGVREVRKPGYYRDHEVPRLWLRVQDTKSKGITKSWVQRVKINGQETNISHGCWPEIPLEEARRRAWAALDKIAAGRDPRRKKAPTVRQMGDRLIEESSGAWRSPGTRKRWEHNLRKYLYPAVGDLPVTRVTTAHLMACLQPLIGNYPEAARQLLSHMQVIFEWVKTQNLREDNPSDVVSAALGPIHPRRRNQPMPALPYDQVTDALQQVRDSGAYWATKAVCEIMAYTAARQGEVRGARWEEIDLNLAIWYLPSYRTKPGRSKTVPLSPPALVVLDDAWERTGGVGLVFPSRTGRPISDGTLRKVFRAHAIPAVPHGFRASFRTYAADHDIPFEVAELALTHKVPGVPDGRDLLEQRRAVMEQWAQYLTKPNRPRLNPRTAPHPSSATSQHPDH